MKQIHWIAVAMLLAVSVGGCRRTESEVILTTTKTPVDPSYEEKAGVQPSPQVIAKRVEYRDALRTYVQFIRDRIEFGAEDPSRLLETLVALAKSESAVAATQGELEVSLQKVLDEAKHGERIVETKINLGVASVHDLTLATAIRMRIELMVIEAKHHRMTSSSPKQ